jgi:nucleotide-binding universal stress UspA family protein
MFKHLLVPVDGSEITDHAIDSSIALAKQLGAAITGFVVEPTAPLPAVGRHPSIVAAETELHEQRTEAHARGVLTRFEALASSAGVAFKGHFERSERVGESIVETARDHGCDMIVMATHGRGAFGELLFGSYTKSVLARSKLPLLVLH